MEHYFLPVPFFLQAPSGHPPPQLKVKELLNRHADLLLHKKVQLYPFPSLPSPSTPATTPPARAPYPNTQSHKHSPPALEKEMAKSFLFLASKLQASADGEI